MSDFDTVEAAKPANGTTASFARHCLWCLEALPVFALFGALRILPVDAASFLGGFVARAIGPWLRSSATARGNLARAFPAKSAAEIATIIGDMWENLGRTVAEVAHIDKFKIDDPGHRIELQGIEHIAVAERTNRPILLLGAHLGNWEVLPLAGRLSGRRMALIYRQANNPHVERLIQRARGPFNDDMVPKGQRAARRIARIMRQGGILGLLIDQKTNNGVAAPFFGREAMTTPLPAMCALHYDCAIFGAQVERLRGAHFRVTVRPLPEIARSGNTAADVLAITSAINAMVETWIRENPAQWMWLHRRWSD
jgi:KDO2-lipid IV(A) lauroyltransferase